VQAGRQGGASFVLTASERKGALPCPALLPAPTGDCDQTLCSPAAAAAWTTATRSNLTLQALPCLFSANVNFNIRRPDLSLEQTATLRQRVRRSLLFSLRARRLVSDSLALGSALASGVPKYSN